MEAGNPISDPMMSRRGELYSLRGLRRLMAAMAAMEKNEKIFPPAPRSVDTHRNAGKRARRHSAAPTPETGRNHEQV